MNTKKALKMPTESDEQIALFEWAQRSQGKYPELGNMYAIPNGGSRHKIEAINLKKGGVKAGVPDICLAVPCGKYHGLYIELKRLKGGVTSQQQKKWIECLNEQGYLAAVCKGCDEAIQTIKQYLVQGDKNE